MVTGVTKRVATVWRRACVVMTRGNVRADVQRGFTGNLCVQGKLPFSSSFYFLFFIVHNDGKCVVCQYYHYEVD